MVIIIKKFRGSTLIEAVVAMVIISIVLGLCTLIILNLKRNNGFAYKTETYNTLNNELIKTKEEKTFQDEVLEYPGFYIQKSYFPYYRNKKLNILKLELYNQGTNQKLLEIQELININEF